MTERIQTGEARILVVRAHQQAVYKKQVSHFVKQARAAPRGSIDREMFMKLARMTYTSLMQSRARTQVLHEELRVRRSKR